MGRILNPVTGVLIRKGEDTETQRRSPCEDEAEMGGTWPPAKEHLGPPEVQRDKEIHSPTAFRGRAPRMTPRSETPSLQKCERTHFCCVNPRSLWLGCHSTSRRVTEGGFLPIRTPTHNKQLVQQNHSTSALIGSHLLVSQMENWKPGLTVSIWGKS